MFFTPMTLHNVPLTLHGTSVSPYRHSLTLYGAPLTMYGEPLNLHETAKRLCGCPLHVNDETARDHSRSHDAYSLNAPVNRVEDSVNAETDGARAES